MTGKAPASDFVKTAPPGKAGQKGEVPMRGASGLGRFRQIFWGRKAVRALFQERALRIAGEALRSLGCPLSEGRVSRGRVPLRASRC